MAKLHARPSNQYRYEHYDPRLTVPCYTERSQRSALGSAKLFAVPSAASSAGNADGAA